MTVRDQSWYRAVVESLPQYIWVGNTDGLLTFVNPRLYPLLGMSEREEKGHGWLERIHPDERDKAIATWKRSLELADEFHIEYRLQVQSGVYRWFVARARPELGPDAKPVRWIGTLDDVHAEVETRQKLALEQVRLAKMAAASPQMLYSFWSSPDGSRAAFPYASPAFLNLFELDAEELARDATSFFRLGNEEDAPAVGASVQVSARDLSHWRQQWRATAPKLGELWLEAHAMPVREPDGSTTWHGMVSDITERRRQEQELRELNVHLEQRVAERTLELELANRELEAFSYSVSHDLREPLRAVNGFSQAVLEDYAELLPPEARQHLAAIRQGALRMGQLIDDLLAFSRLGRQPLKRRTVNVRSIVDECLKALLAAGGKARVSLGELAPCEADPALTQQVFANLLSNAFKYSRKRDDAEVEVLSTRDDAGKVVYSVRDNGTGFDMKYGSKLFQVFQRLHRTSEFEGTGVGLAIVHRIVSRHGGRVWFDAAPDQGATFFFTLEA